MAHKYLSEGDGEKAISAYKKALQIKADDADLHYELDKLYHDEWKRSYEVASKK